MKRVYSSEDLLSTLVCVIVFRGWFVSFEFFAVGTSKENCLLAREKLRGKAKVPEENEEGNSWNIKIACQDFFTVIVLSASNEIEELISIKKTKKRKHSKENLGQSIPSVTLAEFTDVETQVKRKKEREREKMAMFVYVLFRRR